MGKEGHIVSCWLVVVAGQPGFWLMSCHGHSHWVPRVHINMRIMSIHLGSTMSSHLKHRGVVGLE